MNTQCPVILTHGLFGWGPAEVGGFPYWGIAVLVDSPLPRHVASVGPVSSVHDRACELAYQIKGGTVDYGKAHAEEAGHGQLGRTYTEDAALYPEWSADHPVHLVGHSMGGPTIWMLQHLLAIDYFGWGSSADWVKSITAISGVMNGSTATYFLGCNQETGLLDEATAGDFLAAAIELHIRATGDAFDRIYDFDLDHWDMAGHPNEPFGVYVERLAHSPMWQGKDNAAYSLTIQGLLEQCATCETHPTTYYFSHVTEQTHRGFLTRHHLPDPLMNPFLIPTALYIGRKRFREPFYDGFRSSEWWENDGLVPVYSQMYPRIAGNHEPGQALVPSERLEPGKWYYEMLHGFDHIDIVAMPEFGKVGAQADFYRDLFNRLATL